MKRLAYFSVLVIVILASLLTSAAQAPANGTSPTWKAIEATNEAFMAAFNAHNAAAVASYYTVDAWLMPPNSDILQGRDAIQAFWQAVMDMGIDSVKLEILEVDALGNTAVEVSHFTLYLADGTVADYGKYMVEWKRVKGHWYLNRDIWNTSLPPAP